MLTCTGLHEDYCYGLVTMLFIGKRQFYQVKTVLEQCGARTNTFLVFKNRTWSPPYIGIVLLKAPISNVKITQPIPPLTGQAEVQTQSAHC